MKDDGISADERQRDWQWTAMRCLAEHELLDEAYWNNGRSAAWTIGKRGTSVHKVEIVAGIMGSLVVHGDWDLVRFAAYGDRTDAWSRLLWMGDCRDVGYYVAQKATIGSGRNSVSEYDENVACYELQRRIRAAREEEDLKLAKILSQALSYVSEEKELRAFLDRKDKGYDFWEWTIGSVLSGHVIISHVALNKCAWLLRERHGAEGPRQCRPPPPGGPLESPQKGCSLTP